MRTDCISARMSQLQARKAHRARASKECHSMALCLQCLCKVERHWRMWYQLISFVAINCHNWNDFSVDVQRRITKDHALGAWSLGGRCDNRIQSEDTFGSSHAGTSTSSTKINKNKETAWNELKITAPHILKRLQYSWSSIQSMLMQVLFPLSTLCHNSLHKFLRVYHIIYIYIYIRSASDYIRLFISLVSELELCLLTWCWPLAALAFCCSE